MKYNNVGAAFALIAVALCGRAYAQPNNALPNYADNSVSVSNDQPAPDVSSQYPSVGAIQIPASAYYKIRYVIDQLEGHGCVNDDNRHGVTCFGINGQESGLGERVRNLGLNGSIRWYQNNIWNKYNIGSLPEDMQTIALADFTQFGPTGLKLLEQASGNPWALWRANNMHYRDLINQDPAWYLKSGIGSNLSEGQKAVQAWQDRQDKLREYLANNFGGDPGNDIRIMPLNLSSPYLVDANNNQAYGAKAAPIDNTNAYQAALAAQSDFPEAAQSTVENKVKPVSFWDNLLRGTEIAFSVLEITAAFILLQHLLNKPETKQEWIELRDSLEQRYQSFRNTASSQLHKIKLQTFGTANKPTVEKPMSLREMFLRVGLTLSERKAYIDVIGETGTTLQNNKLYKDYSGNSFTEIKGGSVFTRGETAIEKALCWAAQSYNNKCEIEFTSPEHQARIVAIVERMVNEGRLASGFEIIGVRKFDRIISVHKFDRMYDEEPLRPAANDDFIQSQKLAALSDLRHR